MPATGSDTRMYSPRSESNLGWTKDDDDYKHGYGDPEQMEITRDKKQEEQAKPSMTEDLPHLQFSIPKPEPSIPPMMGEEEEEPPEMDDQFNEGQQFGAQTGMPDVGNLSIGNATGTMPAPGGMLTTGEPMSDAWSSLMKYDPDREVNLQRIAERERQSTDNTNPSENYEGRRFSNESAEERTMCNLCRVNRAQVVYHSDKTNPRVGHEDLDVCRSCWNDMYFSQERGDGQKYTDAMAINEGKIDPPPVQSRNFPPTNPDVLEEIANRINTGEPMSDAWSSLMKSQLDDMGSAKPKAWKQRQFEIQPGGARIETANTRRAKRVSRNISPAKKRGLDQAPLSVHRTHLGISTKQPLRLFPRAYGQQQATQSRRKLMGNVPNMPAGHGLGAESDYNPKSPSVASSQGLQMREPRTPTMRGQSFGKSEELALIKQDIEEIQKKQSYMQFTQMRRLVEQLKDALEQRDRSKKAAVSSGPGEKGKAGHMEAQNKTTRPTGATEDLANIPESWGAPSTLFAAPGSGRVA
jgi:hypothetical protein